MKRLSVVSLFLFLALGLAAPLTLRAVGTYENLVLLGDGPIRSFVDPRAHALFLPGATLAPPAELPEGIEAEQKPDGLYLRFGQPYSFSLSGDERRLQAVRVAQLPPPAPAARPAAPDDRQRALFVLVNPQDRVLVEAVVRQLDAPRPQVFFEAEILEVNRNQTQSLGINYDDLLRLKFNEGLVPKNPLDLGALTRAPLSLSITLNFLQEQGAARVLARPRVATLDGLEARINATQTTPLIVPGQGGAQSVQNITTGITLRMLPKVGPEEVVEVQVGISVSIPTGVTSQGVPQFSSREANTTVRVRNGEPLVIGGLLESRRIEGTQKVPLLGDIPLLGELFKTTSTNTNDTDLVIVITPRLLTPPR